MMRNIARNVLHMSYKHKYVSDVEGDSVTVPCCMLSGAGYRLAAVDSVLT